VITPVHGAWLFLLQRRAVDVHLDATRPASEPQIVGQPGDLAQVAGEAGSDLLPVQKAVRSRMGVVKLPTFPYVAAVRR
jgi:hypothetical protein